MTADPTVSIATPWGEATVVVEIAASAEQIQRGLMYRDYLAPYAGMLFVMGADGLWPIYMRNTRIPLDLIYITRDLVVAGVISNAVPYSETWLRIGTPSRYVLEVNGGWAAAHQITAGAPVRFSGLM